MSSYAINVDLCRTCYYKNETEVFDVLVLAVGNMKVWSVGVSLSGFF